MAGVAPFPATPPPAAAAAAAPSAGDQIAAAAAEAVEVKAAQRRGVVYKRLKVEVDLVNRKMTEFQACRAQIAGLKERIEAANDAIFIAEKKHQDAKATFDREVQGYELKMIQVALKKQNKIAVDGGEYMQLMQLKHQRDNEEQGEKMRIKMEVQMKVPEAEKFKELEFQEKYAVLAEQQKARDTELENMRATIKQLRAEVASQKKLSSDIAKAMSKV